jgi:hypothetical protein
MNSGTVLPSLGWGPWGERKAVKESIDSNLNRAVVVRNLAIIGGLQTIPSHRESRAFEYIQRKQ